MKNSHPKHSTSPGYPIPFGANIGKFGTQFSIFSRNATSVTLLLFYDESPDSKYDEIILDPDINKTGDIWHIWIESIVERQLYGYLMDGPYDPVNGHRFNKNKMLIDPYARAITDNFKWDLTKARGYDPDSPDKDLSFSDENSIVYVPRSIVIKNKFHSNHTLNKKYRDLIIYELHVKGFTIDPGSCVKNPGTFHGLKEKIPYLKELGITAVELLPIQEFDTFENININPNTGEKLTNYWGYSTLAFFAPKGKYSSTGAMGEQIEEFRSMVKAFHDADIEVILDVVFNHTSEGDQKGPTISFRGIDNSIYYILEDDNRYYKNYSGCGNTFNCNHPLVRDFILDCLRYWVIEMKVDGFRFDLASILGRDQDGNILSNPPLIETIEEDPVLRDTKIIAEAWDAAGAYQVGAFPGRGRWADWNGKFRDDVRHFWRGDPDTVGHLATRISGSADIYSTAPEGQLHSINFVTCHDGFTLNDLVSYNFKNNTENGEDNRDGENNNLSNNLGMDGPALTPLLEKTRIIQIKNFLATLFLSQGIPMLLMGDEIRRTQKGNNNSYCQDNEISWMNWELLKENEEIFRFTKKMILFRKEHPTLRRDSFFTGKKTGNNSHRDISWHGHEINKPDWSAQSHSIAALIYGKGSDDSEDHDCDIYIIFNSSMTARYYDIPPAPHNKKWKLSIDTSRSSPEDIYESGKEPVIDEKRYFVNKLSLVVLITEK